MGINTKPINFDMKCGRNSMQQTFALALFHLFSHFFLSFFFLWHSVYFIQDTSVSVTWVTTTKCHTDIVNLLFYITIHTKYDKRVRNKKRKKKAAKQVYVFNNISNYWIELLTFFSSSFALLLLVILFGRKDTKELRCPCQIPSTHQRQLRLLLLLSTVTLGICQVKDLAKVKQVFGQKLGKIANWRLKNI